MAKQIHITFNEAFKAEYEALEPQGKKFKDWVKDLAKAKLEAIKQARGGINANNADNTSEA